MASRCHPLVWSSAAKSPNSSKPSHGFRLSLLPTPAPASASASDPPPAARTRPWWSSSSPSWRNLYPGPYLEMPPWRRCGWSSRHWSQTSPKPESCSNSTKFSPIPTWTFLRFVCWIVDRTVVFVGSRQLKTWKGCPRTLEKESLPFILFFFVINIFYYNYTRSFEKLFSFGEKKNCKCVGWK